MARHFQDRSGEDSGNVKLHAPATRRNRDAILEVLRQVLPHEGILLEVASGTGEHAAWMAPQLLPLVWQPSDADPAMRASIAAHSEEANSPNIMPPLNLEVHSDLWPLSRADALFCCNLLHIAPWTACEALMNGAARTLSPGGLLVIYGPFKRGGEHTAPSNAAFDRQLREENAAWGVRDLEAVTSKANLAGLELRDVIEMPANNLSLVFTRT